MNASSKIEHPRILLLSAIIVIFIIISGLFLLDFGRFYRPSTQRTAEAYLAAILEGDKTAAMALMRLEPLCSGAGMEAQVDLQIAAFGLTKTRNISILVHDLSGSVAYNPGTEGADIHFEYKQAGSQEWLQGELGVVTFEHRDEPHSGAFRAICWLWMAE